tara:strand:- start:323 stop:1012 length:690 start_codon:yes stop_codon:yes gene_type:complete
MLLILLITVIYVICRCVVREDDYEPRILKGFVTEEQVEHIKSIAHNGFKESVVGTTSYTKDYNIRKSATAWVDVKNDANLQNIINKGVNIVVEDGKNGKCYALSGSTNWTNCEKLQVVRYQPGGFYKPHHDTPDRNNVTDKTQKLYKVSGPRISTIIIILSHPDEYEGGATEFPNLNKKFKLNKGDALLFHNIDKHGNLFKKSLHGGATLTHGEKQIANIWIHEGRPPN